jgi:hypothetical protein
MKDMLRYYLSRAFISMVFGGLVALVGTPWWGAVLVGMMMFAIFVWAPHSGRYLLHPELGTTPLRRDEYSQTINDKAARNAFVVSTLMIGGSVIYFGLIAPSNVPFVFLSLTLVLGWLTYFISNAWLRRS